MDNTIRFWGVRGSTPSPGASTARVGGNTSCVDVRLGGEQIIIDAGTGLRALGSAEGGRPINATILFSHVHWDHIQGIPFFAPFYHRKSRITCIGPVGLREALEGQMSQPTFPIGMEVFGATIEFVEIEPEKRFTIGEVEVKTAALNHPGGAIGYRLSRGSTSVVYICDHETTEAGSSAAVRALAEDATVLICDAQYTPEEYTGRIGWGHSTFEQVVSMARSARVLSLYLTHHEPNRSDEEMEALELQARALFDRLFIAREGDVVSCLVDGGCVDQEGRQVAMGPPPPSISTQL